MRLVATRHRASSGDRSTMASSPRALKRDDRDECGRSLILDGSALWGSSFHATGP